MTARRCHNSPLEKWACHSLGWPLWVIVCVAAASCSHLPRRGPVDQDVIIARQLSQQGMDALHKGSVPQAEERFSRAIEHCPGNTTARYQLANCLWQRGAREEAIDQLKQAIALSGGEDVEMIVELGYMWANMGRLELAMEQVDQAIRAAPNDALAWRLRGDVLREQKDWTEALASYHRSLTYDASSAEVQLSVAEVYNQLDRPARVLATLHRLEDQLPPERQPERMIVLKSQSLQQLERYDEAVQVLRIAQDERRLSHRAMVRLAQAQVSAGQYGEAQLTIKRVLPGANSTEQASLRQLLADMATRRTSETTTFR